METILINIKEICSAIRGRLFSENISLHSGQRSVLDAYTLQCMKDIYTKCSNFCQFCSTVMNLGIFLCENKANNTVLQDMPPSILVNLTTLSEKPLASILAK